MGNAQIIIPIIIVLLSFFWAYPVLRLLQASLVEKAIDGRVALLALGAHLVAAAALWRAHQYVYLLLYLSVTTLLWLLSPTISNMAEYAALRKLRDEDIQRFQRILAMDPHNAAAHAALADLHLEQGHYDEAIAGYQQAIEIQPDLARAERWKLEHAIKLRDRRQDHQPQPAPPAAPAAPPEPADAEEEPRKTEEPPPRAWNWYDSFE